MTGMLYAIARFCVRRRDSSSSPSGCWRRSRSSRSSHRLGDNTNDNLTLPGTDSQQRHRRADPLLPGPGQRHQPDRAPHSPAGKLTDSEERRCAVNEAAYLTSRKAAPRRHRSSARSPRQGASALSPRTRPPGYLSVTTRRVSPGRCPWSDAQTLIDAAAAAGCRRPGIAGADRRPARPEGLQAGDRVQRAHRDPRRDGDPRLHVRHGRRHAAADRQRPSSPSLATLAIVRILGHVADRARRWRPTLATMIGLGVGIDYALFIVTRHFRGLGRRGSTSPDSIARADRHLRRGRRLRRRHGDDRARVARRGRHPARHHPRV